MLFERSKMDDISVLPVSRHGPGDPFLRIRNGISKNGTDPVQSGMDFFILQSNILIDRLRLYTIVILTLSTELSAAFWAFPLFILCFHDFVIIPSNQNLLNWLNWTVDSYTSYTIVEIHPM